MVQVIKSVSDEEATEKEIINGITNYFLFLNHINL